MVSFTGEDQYQVLSQGNKQPASRVIHKKVNYLLLILACVGCGVLLLRKTWLRNLATLKYYTSLKCFVEGTLSPLNLEKCDPNKKSGKFKMFVSKTNNRMYFATLTNWLYEMIFFQLFHLNLIWVVTLLAHFLSTSKPERINTLVSMLSSWSVHTDSQWLNVSACVFSNLMYNFADGSLCAP